MKAKEESNEKYEWQDFIKKMTKIDDRNKSQTCMAWVLHIAKVVYFFSPSLPNVEWPILGPLPFFFYQKSFIFRFLENCF